MSSPLFPYRPSLRFLFAVLLLLLGLLLLLLLLLLWLLLQFPSLLLLTLLTLFLILHLRLLMSQWGSGQRHLRRCWTICWASVQRFLHCHRLVHFGDLFRFEPPSQTVQLKSEALILPAHGRHFEAHFLELPRKSCVWTGVVLRDNMDMATRVMAAAHLMSFTTVPLMLLEQTAPLSTRSITSRT